MFGDTNVLRVRWLYAGDTSAQFCFLGGELQVHMRSGMNAPLHVTVWLAEIGEFARSSDGKCMCTALRSGHIRTARWGENFLL